MYVIDRIEKHIAILENRENNKIIEVNLNDLPRNVMEGDIIDIIDNRYCINKNSTKEIKSRIRNRFNKLKNK